MFHMLQPIRFVVSLFLLMSFMTACGGGEGASSDSGTGKAAILLTDRAEEKITDREGNVITSAQEIGVTFSEMALKPVKGPWVSVFNGPPDISVNLLALQGKADLIDVVDLPVGAYDKARIKVENAWFVDAEGVRHDVIVPSGKVTIKFKRHLIIRANDETEVLFDFVPGKSIHLIETGSGKFILRPVVRVRVLGEEVTDFVKIEGQIVSVDCNENQLTLDPRHGEPMTVHLEDALIVLKDGSFFSEGDDHGDDERRKRAAQIASCQQLEEGQFVEVVGSSDEEGVVHASLVLIKTEEPASHRLEFTGTLLEVDCDQQTFGVTFSGGEIEATLLPETKLFTADDQAVPAAEVCERLSEAVQKRIEVAGKVENNQVIAAEITLLPEAPVSMTTRVAGTVESISVTGTEVTGFVLKTDGSQSYTITIDAQTEIKDQNGDPVAPNALLNQRVRVEGTLDTGTTPPTIEAAEVVLLSIP
ncbi:MAG: DUF4382 domain-containing protein [Candidatus Manganitrophus sp.]|nr:DUF4382 domain-containing protein [Candidatus Manganitrophus sp.]WDT79234.1 MAG: DUF4382 domain-containing protein [Candidatus Manganitrophus sp.]